MLEVQKVQKKLLSRSQDDEEVRLGGKGAVHVEWILGILEERDLVHVVQRVPVHYGYSAL